MPATDSNPPQAAWRRSVCAAALMLAASFGTPAQCGQLSAEQILTQLARKPPLPAKSIFVPKANPDAATRVCDPELNQRLIRESGQRGEHLTRTLYVEEVASVDLDVAFARGEAKLLPEGKAQLDELAQALRDPSLSGQRLLLAGHTDKEGSAAYNDRLSCERALSARRYLAKRHQIAPARLIPMGFGFEKLKDTDHPLAPINRRVEVRKFKGLNKARAP